MEFSTIDTNQFHFDDPMGLTINIIQSAEAALRGMNSKDEDIKPVVIQEVAQQPIAHQNQIFYATPVLSSTSGVVPEQQEQPIYYSINLTDLQPHPEQEGINISQSQSQMLNTVMVSYSDANGMPVQLPVTISNLNQPPQQQQQPSTPPIIPSVSGEVVAVKTEPPPPTKSKKSKSKKKEPEKGKPTITTKKKKSRKGQEARRYICRFCTEVLTTQKVLESHLYTVHPDKLKYPCSYCDKRFARSDQKNRHENTHDPNRFEGEPKFVCEFCNKKYHLKGSLLGHRKRQHSGIQSLEAEKLKYPCRHCTKRFARSDQRKRHEQIHDPNRFQGEPNFACEYCDKKYHLKGSLDGHRKRQHLGQGGKKEPKMEVVVGV